jgi:hypothetical protein
MRRLALDLPDLDDMTRRWMLEEFESEEAGTPYRSQGLTPLGLESFPHLVRDAITDGDEQSLTDGLNDPALWTLTRDYWRQGRLYSPPRDVESSALTLARTEFIGWYVRGFSRRLMEEGVEVCQIYRAAPAWQPRGECLSHEGGTFAVRAVYAGHRARYWPEPGDEDAFSIPAGPNCHHAIRRVEGF